MGTYKHTKATAERILGLLVLPLLLLRNLDRKSLDHILGRIQAQTRRFAQRRTRRARRARRFFHLPSWDSQHIAGLWRGWEMMTRVVEVERRRRLGFRTLRRAGQRWSTSFGWKGYHSDIGRALGLDEAIRRMWPCIRWLLESHVGCKRRETQW